MSEMLPGDSILGSARSSGLMPWQSLRLLIAPALSGQLIVSLVVHPKAGHPTLHPQIRQLYTPWFPQQHAGDLEHYALAVASLRVAQTGP